MPFLAIPIVIAGVTIGTIGSVGLTVLSFGLTLASRFLAAKPKTPQLTNQSAEQRITQRNPVGYWRVIFGEGLFAGETIYIGTPVIEHRLEHVIVLAAHECDAIPMWVLNDQALYAVDTDSEGWCTTDCYWSHPTFGGFVRAQNALGTTDQAANAYLVANSAGEWTAHHRARGRCLLYTSYAFSETIYAGGKPNERAHIRGLKVYDPRDSGTRWTPNAALNIRALLASSEFGKGADDDEIDDTSFAAAANICDEIVDSPTTGAAAVALPATGLNAFSAVDPATDIISFAGDNLAFQTGDRVEVTSTGAVPTGVPSPAYAIPVRWRPRAGRGTTLMGPVGMKLASSLANAYAGVAADLTDAGSGTITVTKTGEPRYRLNGAIAIQDPEEIDRHLTDMLTACGGRLTYSGGKWRLYGLAWEPPTITLTQDDLRGPIKMPTRVSIKGRFNAVKGVYVSPAKEWQPGDYPIVTSGTYQDADGGERVFAEYNQPFTSSPGQAQRLAKLELARARFEKTLVLQCRLTENTYNIRPGQVVSVTLSRYGFSAKAFEVTEWTPVIDTDDEGSQRLVIDITLRETDESIYDWASSEEAAPAPTPAPTLPDWSQVEEPGTPEIAEALYEGRDGSDVKTRVTVSWAAVALSFGTRYEAEYRTSGASAWLPAGIVDGSITSIIIDDVEPGLYDFRVRTLIAIGAFSDWATRSSVTIYGLSAAPVALTGLTGLPLGGQFRLRWTLHADADVRRGGHIEFRHSPVTSGATESESTTIGDRVDGRSTTADLPFKAGTYFARAVDKLGHAGPWASVVNIGDTVLAWSTLGSIQEDSTFPGTHSGTAILGIALSLDGATAIDSWGDVDDVLDWDTEGGVVSSGTYTFSAGIDLGSVQRARVRGHVRASTANVRDTIDLRTDNIDDWEDFDGDTAPGAADAWIEVRATNDDPSGAPVWSEWQRLEVAEFNARAFQFRAQLRSYDSAYRPEVTELRAFAEDPSL